MVQHATLFSVRGICEQRIFFLCAGYHQCVGRDDVGKIKLMLLPDFCVVILKIFSLPGVLCMAVYLFYVEPSLTPSDEAYLIMVEDVFDMFLDLVLSISLSIFASIFVKEIGLTEIAFLF